MVLNIYGYVEFYCEIGIAAFYEWFRLWDEKIHKPSKQQGPGYHDQKK
jgi:hypothetical protein